VADRLGGERQHRQLTGPDHRRCGSLLPQPLTDAEPVEPLRFRVAPRVARVDRPRQGCEAALDLLVRREVLRPEPAGRTADDHPVDEGPGVLTGHRRERRLQCQVQLGHELGVGSVSGTDHLAAQLHEPAIGQAGLRHPTADPISGLEHQDVRTSAVQVTCRGQPRQTGAEDHRIQAHQVVSSHDASTVWRIRIAVQPPAGPRHRGCGRVSRRRAGSARRVTGRLAPDDTQCRAEAGCVHARGPHRLTVRASLRCSWGRI
jgi:hypothetical protein